MFLGLAVTTLYVAFAGALALDLYRDSQRTEAHRVAVEEILSNRRLTRSRYNDADAAELSKLFS